jgi:DNA polymerase
MSDEFFSRMAACKACKMRASCAQVVLPTGNLKDPILMVCGEAPGSDEDRLGEPFIGQAGQCLREVIRATRVINRSNTVITNVISCRPPGNKFPKDESPNICTSAWLFPMMGMMRPRRLLLLGGVALKHVAGLEGITAARGKWIDVKGIRAMASFHPSFVIRRERDGDLEPRESLVQDVGEVAHEVKGLIDAGAAGVQEAAVRPQAAAPLV